MNPGDKAIIRGSGHWVTIDSRHTLYSGVVLYVVRYEDSDLVSLPPGVYYEDELDNSFKVFVRRAVEEYESSSPS